MKANIKTHDLVHKGLYSVDKQIVWFKATNHFFYSREDNKIVGFLTGMQRSRDLACECSFRDDNGFLSIHKKFHVYAIPLTKEILAKNGYVPTGGGDNTMGLMTGYFEEGIRYHIYVSLKSRTMEIHVSYPESDPSYVNTRKYNRCELRFCDFTVHELQQALHMCGLHELADNFKVE